MKPYYEHAGVTIYQGDVISCLREMESESVNCVVTSPPYWGLRDYGVAGQLGLEKTPQEFVAKIVEVFSEVRRVLRNDGTCWINLGDSYNSSPNQRKAGDGDTAGYKQASNVGSRLIGSRSAPNLKPKDLCGIPWRVAFALQDDGWYLRQDIIWSKPNPMPESVTDRCTKAHEYLFLLTKSARYHYDADAIKEECTADHAAGNNSHKGTTAYLEGAEEHRTKQGLVAYAQKTRKVKMPDGWDTGAGGHGSFHRNGREKGETRELGEKGESADSTEVRSGKGAAFGRGAGWRDDPTASVAKRNKRSVWEIATQPYSEAHFATYPEKLVEPCILAGCPAGGVVLDPFGGSMTTLFVAQRLQCRAIGIELNAEYIEIGLKRFQQDVMQFNEASA